MAASLIDDFKDDLDNLGDLLGQWIRGSQSTVAALNQDRGSSDLAHQDLDAAMAKAARQAADLNASASALQHASEKFSAEVQGAAKNIDQAVCDAGQHCVHKQADLSVKASALEQETKGHGTALGLKHQAVGNAFEAAHKERNSYADETRKHHSKSGGFVAETKKDLSGHRDQVYHAADTAHGQLGAMTTDLGHHLSGPVTGVAVATTAWLDHEMRPAVSKMVSSRLETTLQQLTHYHSSVHSFGQDIDQVRTELMTMVTGIVEQLPNKVKDQAQTKILRTIQDLVTKQLVDTLASIGAGAAISAAAVGAMPILKTVSASLRLLLAGVTLSSDGRLPEDVPEDYEDERLDVGKLAPGLARTPVGAITLGTLQLLNRGVADVDKAITRLEVAAQGVGQAVQHAVVEGIEAGQEFLHELFCPLCGSECEVAS